MSLTPLGKLPDEALIEIMESRELVGVIASRYGIHIQTVSRIRLQRDPRARMLGMSRGIPVYRPDQRALRVGIGIEGRYPIEGERRLIQRIMDGDA